jgi:hypothetical protein
MTRRGGFAGQRARVPPDPIPNSEVKPCSVPSCSVVLGHVNLGKLAAYFSNKFLNFDQPLFVAKKNAVALQTILSP